MTIGLKMKPLCMLLLNFLRTHIDKYDKLSDAEKIFGVYVQKPSINAILMVTKEVP